MKQGRDHDVGIRLRERLRHQCGDFDQMVDIRFASGALALLIGVLLRGITSSRKNRLQIPNAILHHHFQFATALQRFDGGGIYQVEAFMPKTAVGLFENAALANGVVREIEHLGFPRREVRKVEEPKTFDITGVMSFPRLDFEVELGRELSRIGATNAEVEGYVEGLRRGGALVFATGTDEKVDAAAAIMNRNGAVEIEEAAGPEPDLPHVRSGGAPAIHDPAVLMGRIRQSGDGASFFVW